MKALAFVLAFVALPSCLAVAASASTWTAQSSPTVAALEGVAFSDSNTWVAVGDAGSIVRSTDGGRHWGAVASPVGDLLHAVAFRGGLGLAVGVGGRVLRSTDAGASWAVVARPTTKILFAVSIADSFAVITGEEGRIFVSTDDGLTWTPHFAGTASALFGVSARGNAAVGAGGAGAVVMSTFRGTAWGLTVLGSQLTFFYGVSLATPATGWAVGTSDVIPSIIIRTNDGGFVWNAQTAPSTDILFGVSFRSLTDGTVVGGTGTILHTTDAGLHWVPETSGVTATLQGVAIGPSGVGVAVGAAGTILRGVPDVPTAVEPPIGPDTRLGVRVLGNPVRAGSSARFALHVPGRSPVAVRILDVAGRRVAALPTQWLGPGAHEVVWTPGSDDGTRVAAGVYLAEVRAGGDCASARFVILE